MQRTSLPIILCLFAMPALADQSSYFNIGTEFGSSQKDLARNQLNEGTASSHVPNYRSGDPASQYYEGGMGDLQDPALADVSSCTANNKGEHEDAVTHGKCEGVRLLMKDPGKKNVLYPLNAKNDPLFKSRDQVRNNASSYLGGLTPGNYQGCVEKEIADPDVYEEQHCSRFLTLEEKNCTEKLNLQCQAGGDGCDAGGIVPGSVGGDMVTTFEPDGNGNYKLRFGVIGDNYWPGDVNYGQVYDRSMTFEIKDKSKISGFDLTQVAHDDWLLVKVNDHVVYVGPRGGDRLDLVPRYLLIDVLGGGDTQIGNWVQYCASENCRDYPELKQTWYLSGTINLMPYIKNGINTVFTRTIVAGAGESAIEITTRQYCDPVCTEVWDDQCSTYKIRSQQ